MYRTRGAILFCAVMLNGCGFLHVKVPVSAETVIPTGTATSWVELRKKLQHLQECVKNDEQLDGSQLTITHVFQYLNITDTTPGVRELVTATQKQESIYGKNTFIYLHSLEEKALHEREIDQIKVFEITWRDLKSPVEVHIVKAVYLTQGVDATSYLIFKNIEEEFILTRVLFPQQAEVRIQRPEYLPRLIGTVTQNATYRGVREQVPQ